MKLASDQYNTGNARGYPDVAVNAENYPLYIDGNLGVAGGTSGSTPIFAAIISRINNERIAVGKSRLGFLNPTMYANPGMFNDIVGGSNPGCGTNGFEAVPGWGKQIIFDFIVPFITPPNTSSQIRSLVSEPRTTRRCAITISAFHELFMGAR